MFLEYGVNTDGGLVWIGEVGRGASVLRCPYCNGLLTAKKGNVKEHHFAHTGATCRQTERDQDVIALPAFDNFNLHLPPKVLKELGAFHVEPDGTHNRELLERHELIKYNRYAANKRGAYELTKKGKLVVGDLSLDLFNEYQEPLIHARHDELQDLAYKCYGRADIERRLAAVQEELATIRGASNEPLSGDRYRQHDAAARKLYSIEAELKATGTLDLQTALSDLRLFRAQWRRVLACSLYFLEIDGGALYKVGVTTRSIEQRTAEIAADLLPHRGSVPIRVLGVWPHRGNVELYFKYRYSANQQPIGSLTEYYTFADPSYVLRDLRRMKDKVLGETEEMVFNGESSIIERQIKYDETEQKRRDAIREGMKRSAARGKSIGRPAGQETSAEFLAKPDSLAIAAALADGASIREAANQTGASTATVQKVKAALAGHYIRGSQKYK